ncbi:MAG: rhomboid family intramembrane serine protease [Lachnospiraceae bacterium]|nr:rhomboid family intramembrane serine protease [Lachnospiraceae bacterium]
MHRLIGQYFFNNNYNEVQLNIDDVKVYEKGDTLYSIYNMQKCQLTVEQFNNIQQQLYSGIENAGVHINNNIVFICAGDEKYIGTMVDGMKRHNDIQQVISIVDTSRAVIMMEQGAEERWGQLCIDISKYLQKVTLAMYEKHIKNEVSGAECEDDEWDVYSRSTNKKTIWQEIKSGLIYGTIWLAIINVILHISTHMVGYEKFGAIVEQYANNWIRVTEHSEWYRVITSMFLHSDMDHLVGNMLSLCAIGTHLEKIIGRKKFLFAYFVSGIIAGLASLGYNMYLNEDINSIGASGAIYGICGLFVIVLVAHRDRFGKGNAIRLVIYLVLVGYSSLSTPNIDHMAHIGGLLAGMILGIFMILIPSRMNKNKQVNRYED